MQRPLVRIKFMEARDEADAELRVQALWWPVLATTARIHVYKLTEKEVDRCSEGMIDLTINMNSRQRQVPMASYVLTK